MFVNAILSGFFGMDEQVEQGILAYHLCNDLFELLGDYTDLNAASDCLLINNAVLQISNAPVELFFLFVCFCLLFIKIKILEALTQLVLRRAEAPFIFKFNLSE